MKSYEIRSREKQLHSIVLALLRSGDANHANDANSGNSRNSSNSGITAISGSNRASHQIFSCLFVRLAIFSVYLSGVTLSNP